MYLVKRIAMFGDQKRKEMKNVILLALTLIVLASCSKDDVDYAAIDEQKIQDYLEENNLDATRHASGLYYNVTVQGSGHTVPPGAVVTVRYTGKLLNGEVFDSGVTTGPLSNYIQAWQIGIPLLKQSSEAIFYCPSELCYGGQAVNSIPAHSVLIFNVKVVDF